MKGREEEETVTFFPLLLSRPNTAVCLALLPPFPPLSTLPIPFLLTTSLFLFSPPPPPPPFSRESGRRKQRVAELQNFGNLSHPSLEASTTAPLVGDRAAVCLSLFLPPPSPPQDELLLLTFVPATLLCSLPPGGAAAEAASGI